MAHTNVFLSGDWGTSNFRLRKVALNNLEVLRTHKTSKGIKELYMDYKASSFDNQTEFFLNYLKEQLSFLDLIEQESYTMVLSGMASANIGLKELPYGSMPISKKQNTLVTEKLSLTPTVEIILVSGSADQEGVMRGEETQALGLLNRLADHGNGVLLLPGTHSKHLRYEENAFTSFKSYMTGELFQLFTQQSILSNNVSEAAWGKKVLEDFISGVKIGLANQLTSQLFSIRSQQLQDKIDKENNFYKLSGMLIGDELSYLKERLEGKVFLASDEPFFTLYSIALRQVLDEDKIIFLDKEELEKAFLKGQKQILEIYGQ